MRSYLLIVDLNAWAVGVLFRKAPMLMHSRWFSLSLSDFVYKVLYCSLWSICMWVCRDMTNLHSYTCRHSVIQALFIVDAFIFHCRVYNLCQKSSVIKSVDFLLGLQFESIDQLVCVHVNSMWFLPLLLCSTVSMISEFVNSPKVLLFWGIVFGILDSLFFYMKLRVALLRSVKIVLEFWWILHPKGTLLLLKMNIFTMLILPIHEH